MQITRANHSFNGKVAFVTGGGTEEGRKQVIAQQPVGRVGKPEEIASAVLWMCSDNAGFLVGHALVMDGRQTA